MEPVFALIALAVVLFISTNVDDLVVLVGFFADATFRPREIVAGQYAGVAVLFVVSTAGNLLALVVPPVVLGLLGTVPIGIGISKLLLLRQAATEANKSEMRLTQTSYGNIGVVSLVTISNGADNIGVYLPAFAAHSASQIAIIALIFVAMTGVWCLLAYRLVSHPRFGAPLRRYAHIISPVVLIGLGILILYNAGSIAWLIRAYKAPCETRDRGAPYLTTAFCWEMWDARCSIDSLGPTRLARSAPRTIARPTSPRKTRGEIWVPLSVGHKRVQMLSRMGKRTSLRTSGHVPRARWW